MDKRRLIVLAKKGQLVRLNKKHKGKEFRSFFHFVGKVKPVTKFENNERVNQPYYEQTETKNGKQMRKLQFVVETADHNDLKVELAGFEMPFANAYSQDKSHNHKVKWDDRFDKSKYPDSTYHLIDTDWDKAESFSNLIQNDVWIEVKGHYDFDSFIDHEKGKINFRRRVIDSLEVVEDGQAIKAGNTVILDKYVTDFESDEFKEINFVDMQIGINSTYQEENDKDTKINAYFLDYGKERSTPHQTDLKVPYVEPEEGKTSLADAFLKLNRLDFVQVQGTDNNRAKVTQVEVETKEIEDDPFQGIGDDATTKQTKSAVTGTDKGIYVTSIVQGTYVREFLSEEEVAEIKPKTQQEQADNPFLDSEQKEDVKEEPLDPNDPFADMSID